MAGMKKDMIAQMRHRIVIEAPVLTPAGGGHFDQEWEEVAHIWAAVEPLTGKAWEHMQAEQLAAPVSHRITCRYIAGVSAKMRIRFGERYFNIRSAISPQEAQEWLVIHAEEHVAL